MKVRRKPARSGRTLTVVRKEGIYRIDVSKGSWFRLTEGGKERIPRPAWVKHVF